MSVTTYISPKYTDNDFPGGPKTLEDKILVFEDRVFGWQLNIAAELMKHDGDAGFAVLHIVTSYFEMIAMYIHGPGPAGSAEYFKKGARAAFPELDDEHPQHVRWFIRSLYRAVRCGLYHQGMTRVGILLSGDIGAPYEFNDLGPGKHEIIINPKLLTDHLRAHLEDYLKRLRDSANAEARTNFEAMYDSELPDD